MNTKPESLIRRLGAVSISRYALDELLHHGGVERQARFNAIFHDFVIVEATSHYADSTIRYIGYHPLFEVAEPFLDAPDYDAVVTREVGDHGIITFTVKFNRRDLSPR